jgi:hypothetical protein
MCNINEEPVQLQYLKEKVECLQEENTKLVKILNTIKILVEDDGGFDHDNTSTWDDLEEAIKRNS